jgi:hypothetical protein
MQKIFNFLIVGLTFFALNIATVEAQLGGDKINRLESSTTGPSATGANLADTKIVDSSVVPTCQPAIERESTLWPIKATLAKQKFDGIYRDSIEACLKNKDNVSPRGCVQLAYYQNDVDFQTADLDSLSPFEKSCYKKQNEGEKC